MPKRSTSSSPHPRGVTLLLALGLVTFLTLGALTSLSFVTSQTDPAGQDRRAKEAFFAAEAGLAEGREWLRLETLAIPSPQPMNTILAGMTPATDVGDPAADPWYPLPLDPSGGDWVSYALATVPDPTGASAIDPGITGSLNAGLELVDPNGFTYQSYPEAKQVRYRVFLRDDADDADPTRDSNGMVWLVSVGQVQTGNGVPTQAVVRVLVQPGNGAVGTGYSYSDKVWDPVHLNEDTPVNANATSAL